MEIVTTIAYVFAGMAIGLVLVALAVAFVLMPLAKFVLLPMYDWLFD